MAQLGLSICSKCGLPVSSHRKSRHDSKRCGAGHARHMNRMYNKAALVEKIKQEKELKIKNDNKN